MICLEFRDPSPHNPNYLHTQRQIVLRSLTFRKSIPRKMDPIWLYQTIQNLGGTDVSAMMKMRVGIGCDHRDRPLQSDVSLKHTRNT